MRLSVLAMSSVLAAVAVTSSSVPTLTSDGKNDVNEAFATYMNTNNDGDNNNDYHQRANAITDTRSLRSKTTAMSLQQKVRKTKKNSKNNDQSCQESHTAKALGYLTTCTSMNEIQDYDSTMEDMKPFCDNVRDNMLEDAPDVADEDIIRAVMPPSPKHRRMTELARQSEERELTTTCTGSIIALVSEIVGLVLCVIGLSGPVAKAAGKTIAGKYGARSFAKNPAKELGNKSASTYDLVKAAAEIFIDVYKTVGFGAIISAIGDNISWWEWLWTGASIAAQVVALYLSGTASLIIQLLIKISNVTTLSLAIKDVAETC